MNGAATTAEWLACGGIGTGVGTVVLGLLKLGLDAPDLTGPRARPEADVSPPASTPPPLPARAPVRRARHAAPLLVVETQPVRCVQPDRARHAKKAA